MKTYNIQASETVFYEVEVQAENEDQARELILSGEIDINDHECDSAGFQVDMVTELEQGLDSDIQ
jgi:predicted rRNA methylase YqxC with S4 and FtsJ domains